jgi:Tfp pilus assembly protein PilO
MLDQPLSKLLTLDMIKAELRTNPRARWLLAVVAVLLVGYAIVELAVRNAALKTEVTRRQRVENQLEVISKETDWADRRQTAEALREQLESRLWSADTDGLTLADFQDWISKAARESALTISEVRPEIDPAATNSAQARRMSASVYGVFDPTAMTRFLALVARNNRVMVVEKLKIQSSPVLRFDLTLTTYLRARDESASGKASK